MRGFLLVLAIPITLVSSGALLDLSRLTGATVDSGRGDSEFAAWNAVDDGPPRTTDATESRNPAGLWRRTSAGWEQTIHWWTASRKHHAPNWAGRLHPALLALVMGGIAIGALVAGTPEHLLLVAVSDQDPLAPAPRWGLNL